MPTTTLPTAADPATLDTVLRARISRRKPRMLDVDWEALAR